MLADIKGPHLDFFGGANSLSHGSARSFGFAVLLSCVWIVLVFTDLVLMYSVVISCFTEQKPTSSLQVWLHPI